MNISKLIFVILTFPIYSLLLLLLFIGFGFITSISLSKLFIYGNVDTINKRLEYLKKIREYVINLKKEE